MTEDFSLAVELAQRELLLTEAERIVHLGSWMWNTGTNAIRWSDELYRIFGLEPRSVEPTTDLFFSGIHPEDLPRVQEVTSRGLATGSPEPVDFRIVRRDRTVRFVHMEAALVKREGSMLLVGSLLDTTERIELERRLRESQKLEAVGTLAGGVAHDFNNFLQVIFGHVDLVLASAALDSRAKRSLDQIKQAARRCQRLTQQLLTFSRRHLLVVEKVDLDAVVDAIEPMMATLVGERVRVARTRSHVPVCVECDPGALEQVLMNLAANARDAMPGGGTITIETDVHEVLAEGQGVPVGFYARLTFRDEGVGIAPEVLARVFDPFFTTKDPGEGTGLGLATSWGIAKQSGGTMTVESEPGRGAVFRMLLPLAARAPGEADRAATASHKLVLVVDDQTELRDVVRFTLESAGYAVLEAANGLDAMRTLEREPRIALVLTDLSMPEMGGLELATAMREAGRAVPLVFMSGFVDERTAALDAPLLRKPFERTELLSVVGARLA